MEDTAFRHGLIQWLSVSRTRFLSISGLCFLLCWLPSQASFVCVVVPQQLRAHPSCL